MNTLSLLRWVAPTAIALSLLGLGQTAIAKPGSVVVPTLPINGSNPGGFNNGGWTNGAGSYPLPPSRPAGSAVVIPTGPAITPTRPPATGPVRLPPVPVVRPPSRPPTYGTVPSGSIPSVPPQGTAVSYRVIVVNSSNLVQEQVKNLVPEAFRTTVNGQSVIQAGIFREQSKARELQQTLAQSNLQASIITGQAPIVSSPIASVPISPGASTPSRSNPIPLPAIPKSGTIVVIDPGHGGGDPGAVGIGGLREAEVVLDISRQVVNLLKQQGVNAVLTRQRDEEIELEPRVQFAEQAKADVFVSIHANSFDRDRTDVSGIETYYNSSDGQPLAKIMQNTLLQDLGARDRGVKSANFYVIKYTSMPAILIEVGFVTGAEDAARLSSSTGRSRIAQSITRGILQYLK